MRGRLIVWVLLSAGIGGADSSGDWMGFAPYPGARQLCSEVVLGMSGNKQVEIHWRSFASRDATADVIRFYASREGKNAERSSDSLEVRHGDDHTMSVYPASKTGVPSCTTKPNSAEKTVIIVSARP